MNFTPQTYAEIAILALVYYGFIRHLQATRGGGLLAGFIGLMLTTLVVFTIVLRQFDLPHLRWLANAALPVLGIALLVIFQPELRLAISRIGNIRVIRVIERFFGTSEPVQRPKVVSAIVVACEHMSKSRTGALIVVQKREGIDGFRSGGVRVNADVSSYVLENIFYKGAPLHDGAVLIIGGRIMYAACHLPSSSDESVGISHDFGTRHRAALGLSEQSDAVVIVVSEERGWISIAQRGTLRANVSLKELEDSITEGIKHQIEALEAKKRLKHSAEAIHDTSSDGEEDGDHEDEDDAMDATSASGAVELSK